MVQRQNQKQQQSGDYSSDCTTIEDVTKTTKTTDRHQEVKRVRISDEIGVDPAMLSHRDDNAVKVVHHRKVKVENEPKQMISMIK